MNNSKLHGALRAYGLVMFALGVLYFVVSDKSTAIGDRTGIQMGLDLALGTIWFVINIATSLVMVIGMKFKWLGALNAILGNLILLGIVLTWNSYKSDGTAMTYQEFIIGGYALLSMVMNAAYALASFR